MGGQPHTIGRNIYHESIESEKKKFEPSVKRESISTPLSFVKSKGAVDSQGNLVYDRVFR